MKNYHLQPGTCLDDKYTIEKVLGEGGFGITYEAYNNRIDMKVAIKELYCKDFINRDTSKSNAVIISCEESKQDFDRAKKRFLKEAKVLCQFQNEPGIVHILDYFEENGTAYIVMNYIEGITLERFIKKNGNMNFVEVLNLIRPVLEILRKLHEKGIIHRDISTNNIMISEDGSANLIDFGATKDLMLTTNTNTTVVYSKRGYTPLEQLVKNGKVGPWSDIYSAMAVCYECMTGNIPPEVLQRSVFDEYKTLKECKIKAPTALDFILSKGLNVDYTKRYQSVEELLADIDLLLEANANPQKKKKKICVCIGALICTILCTVLLSYYFERETRLFKGVETEEFCYYLEEHVSDEDYQSSVEMLKERVEAFVGDEPYVFDVNNDVIRCVVPLSCFDGCDMKNILEAYFLMDRDNIRFLVSEDGVSGFAYNDDLFDDISSVSYKEGNIDITFSDDLLDKNKMLLDDDKNIQLYWVYRNLQCECDLEKIGDYEYRFTSGITENMDRLIACILNQRGQINKYSCQMEIQTNWEKVDNAFYAGKGQCDVKKFKNNYVTLQYTFADYFSQGEWLDVQKEMKNRFDIIGCPYAIGVSESDSYELSVRVFQKDYSDDLFGMLTLGSSDIRICDGWYKSVQYVDRYNLNELLNFRIENNQLLLSAHLEDWRKNSFDSYMKDLEKNELNNYSIMAGNFLVFENGTFEDETFIFEKYNVEEGILAENNDLYVEIMEYIFNSKEEGIHPKLNMKSYCSRFKKLEKKPAVDLNYAKRITKTYENIAKNIKEMDAVDDCYIEDDWNGLGIALYITLPKDYDVDDVESFSDLLSQIIFIATNDKRGILFDKIVFQMVSKSNENVNASKIIVSRETMEDSFTPYYITLIGFEEKESRALKKLEKEMKSRDEYKNINIEYNDYSGE